MPTQAQLDKEQNRTKAHTGTIGMKVQSGGIHDISTSFIVPKKEFPQTGQKGIQDDAIDFPLRDRLIAEEGGGTFELDVVKDDNTAGRASFTGGGTF